MSVSPHATPLIVRQFEAGDESLSFVLRHLFVPEKTGQIDTLLIFLRRKFTLEEKVMRDHDYPFLDEHEAAHRALTERLVKLGAFDLSPEIGHDTLALFARKETIGHVERFDRPLLHWLKSPRETLCAGREDALLSRRL